MSNQYSWAEIVGRLVLQWGWIEHLITMPIKLSNLSDRDFVEIEFKRRLREWRRIMLPLGNKSPHNLDQLYSRIVDLRTTRDNLVHGTFLKYEEKAEYLLHFPNERTKQKLFHEHLREVHEEQRKFAIQHAEFVQDFLARNMMQPIRFDPLETISLIENDLPNIAQKIDDINFAHDKERRKSD